MKKLILSGVIAAALVVLNVAAFSATSVAAPPEPPVTNGCFQFYSYCKDGATLILRPNCSFNNNTGKRCKQHFCESCFPTLEPWIERVDDFINFGKDPLQP